MERVEEIVAARARIAAQYSDGLRSIEGIVPPAEPREDMRVSWFVYVARLTDDYSQADRDAVLRGLSDRGIGCRNYFAPIHLQPFYRDRLGTGEGDYPVTEAVGARTIALPFFNRLREDEIDCVIEAVNQEMGRLR